MTLIRRIALARMALGLGIVSMTLQRLPAQSGATITAQQYDVPGAQQTNINAINDLGVFVGSYIGSNGSSQYFQVSGGVVTILDFSALTPPVSILSLNNNNQMLLVDGTNTLYIYDSGSYSTLDISGTDSNTHQNVSPDYVYSLNDEGQIGGYYTIEDGYGTGALIYGTPYLLSGIQPSHPDLNQGVYTSYPCPQGDAAGGGYVDNLGIIAGQCDPAAVIFEGASSSNISYPNASVIVPTAINNQGNVAGWFSLPSNPAQALAFEYEGGTFEQVIVPNSQGAFSTGVNNSNQVVGLFLGLDGAEHGFITDPSTTPPTQIPQNGELLGGCNCSGKNLVGNPIDVSSGNQFEQAVDYTTAGQNPLSFTRYYNSRGNSASGITTLAQTLGRNWRSNYDRYLQLTSSVVTLERADGQQIRFTQSAGVWKPNTDIDITLTQSGPTWTLIDSSDTKEIYKAISPIEALPQSITLRNGYTQRLQYGSGDTLVSVTDSYGRSLKFAYSEGLLATVTTPDETTITYGYNAVTGGSQLVSVSYDTDPVTSQTYQYGQAGVPFALTAIIDENGNKYASWTYDSSARGLTSQLAGGAGLTTLSYNTSGTTTVTNAEGVVDTYAFTTLQGIPKITSISRASTSNTAAATEHFTYDSNGYRASSTDWNGNKATYVNNAHGLPTTINEAVGSPVARTTTVAYDATWVRLPATIATAGLTTSFTYDASGEVLTKTLTDTTTATVPYSTKGQTRTTTNTWSNSLLASTETPNGNKTSFGYDGSGALISTTDALGHITAITSHTGGGLPETIVDPNGVITTLTYSPRQWLTGSTVSGPGGTFATGLSYDAAGNLTKTTLPDNSYLADTYDAAHRLIQVTNALGDYVSLTLDALSDPTETNISAPGGTLTRKHSGTFDSLGRLLIDTGGAGQTTTMTFDPNGNALSSTDGLGHKIQKTYDDLNRLTTTTDANGGITTIAYDTHDRIISVKDANGNTTSYARNGFGNIIQQISPDSGVTVYRYDLDSNLTQKLDAAGVTTNFTSNALDRLLTTTYPADAAENVAYTYDQAGTGFTFGIGRLTSVTDAVGTLTRAYDERGNLLTEKRKHGTVTLTTGYSYDAASRIASITYPSGSVVSYSRDAAGQVTNVATPSATVATTITHLPFGPVNSFTYGNGVADTRTFDQDYRMIALKDAASGTSAVQSLAYAYDVADNLKTITDSVHTGNSQTIAYDALNRLSSATATDYQTFTYTYDKVGNRLTEGRAGEAPTNDYSYVAGTNRLAGLSIDGSIIESFTYTPTGNIVDFMGANGPMVSLNYDKANRIGTFTENGTQIAQYTYDGFGQRLVKTLAGTPATGTLFDYNRDGSLLEETNISGTAQADYIYLDGTPIGDLAPASKMLYYLHTDHLGTMQLATNSAKATIWAATYEPFGWANNIQGSITQNLRLPGQYFDSETTSYHNGFRDYVAIFGRYGQVDPIGLNGGTNSYAYVSGNPLRKIDKKGLKEEAPSPYEGLGSLEEYLNRLSEQRDFNEVEQAIQSGNYSLDYTYVPPEYMPILMDELNKAMPQHDPMGDSAVCTTNNPYGEQREQLKQGPLEAPTRLYVVPTFNAQGTLEFTLQTSAPLN